MVGVENTATTRAAQAFLKNVTMSNVKDAAQLEGLFKAGQADAIALSRESLVQLAAKFPGSRVLPGAYLSSFVAVAVPKGKPAALTYVSAFAEEAKASGAVRRSLDSVGMQELGGRSAGTAALTSGRLLQLCVGDKPFVALAALRASRQDALVADAEQGVEFAFDPDVDDFAGVRAVKVQSFHSGLPLVAADRGTNLTTQPGVAMAIA